MKNITEILLLSEFEKASYNATNLIGIAEADNHCFCIWIIKWKSFILLAVCIRQTTSWDYLLYTCMHICIHMNIHQFIEFSHDR